MELEQLRALVTVIDLGSLSTASQSLGLSRATLRARVEALEEELGLQLLVRSKRGAAPTEVGERFAARARELLRDAEGLASFGEMETGEVSGELRVLLPPSLPAAMNARFVAQALERYPRLALHVGISERPEHAAIEAYDLIVYFGDTPREGPYRTFVLARVPLRAFASAAYLDQRGHPASLDELDGYTLLAWSFDSQAGTRWPLREGGTHPVQAALTSSDPFMLRMLASAGEGVALIPDPRAILPGSVEQSGLELVLPEHIQGTATARVLLPETTSTTPRSRAAVELSRQLAQGMFGMSFDSL